MAISDSCKRFAVRDVNAPLVQVRAGTSLCREHLVPRGVVDYTRDHFAGSLQAERDVVDREAVREVRGPVQRIHIPAILRGTGVSAALFRDDVVGRKVSAQAFDDESF